MKFVKNEQELNDFINYTKSKYFTYEILTPVDEYRDIQLDKYGLSTYKFPVLVEFHRASKKAIYFKITDSNQIEEMKKFLNFKETPIVENKQVGVGIAIIVEKDNKILMGKRLSKHAYGLDGLPGGRIEYGETLVEAVKRELKEETNLEAINIELVTASSNVFEDGSHWVTMFYKVSAKGELINLEPHKKESWRWEDPLTYTGKAMPGLQEYINKLKQLEELKKVFRMSIRMSD